MLIELSALRRIIQEEFINFFRGVNEATDDQKRACMRLVYADVERQVLKRINAINRAEKGDLMKPAKK